MEEDILRLNVSLFMRLIELAREDIKDDVSLHYITEKLTEISQDRVATMEDYDEIFNYMKQSKKSNELEDIKRLGGLT